MRYHSRAGVSDIVDSSNSAAATKTRGSKNCVAHSTRISTIWMALPP
jgi:hypothetical protein